MNNNEVLKIAVDLAREAGKIQLEHFRRLKSDEFEKKSSVIDIVTFVDKMSEDIIIKGLKQFFPEHSILSEESGEHINSTEYLWVIDPLDGTVNYSQGLPIFSISIALQRNNETIIGLVYAPYLNELYTSIVGQGAYLNGEPLKVSKKKELLGSVVVSGFPYDRCTNDLNNTDYFSHMVTKVRGIRRFGSAAYDLALVAAGNFDGYWEMALCQWDVAAGMLLVTEAGGVINHFRNDRKISIIAGNEIIVESILKELKKVR